MPLLDHFRPPLSLRRHWHSFHNSWATYLAADLNRQLPPEYFAEANVQFGIEIDVAAFEEPDGGGGFHSWTPPAPTSTIPYPVVTDQVEVLVYLQQGGPRLAGAIEFVSPANKDRQTHRDAFVSQCVTLLNQGVGLVMVDVVTERHANLHAELSLRLGTPSDLAADLYATAYRRVERDGQMSLDQWVETLALGQALPTMPLWVPGGHCLAVALEDTYNRTCAEQRVHLNGRQGESV
jgi:hypothetical protein